MKEYIILTVKFQKEGDVWTAQCLELGTATDADSLEEAEEAIEEAILLHLEGIEEAGERERFFAEHRIKVHHHKSQKVSIPISFEKGVYFKTLVQPISALVSEK